MIGIGERKLDESFEVAWKISDVVTSFVRQQLTAITRLPSSHNCAMASVSWISPRASGFTRRIMSKITGEKTYRPAIARLLGASSGFGFSTKSTTRNHSPSPPFDFQDAVVDRSGRRHLFDGDHATGVPHPQTAAVIRSTVFDCACKPRMESPNATRKGCSPAKFSPHKIASPRPFCIRWRV